MLENHMILANKLLVRQKYDFVRTSLESSTLIYFLFYWPFVGTIENGLKLLNLNRYVAIRRCERLIRSFHKSILILGKNYDGLIDSRPPRTDFIPRSAVYPCIGAQSRRVVRNRVAGNGAGSIHVSSKQNGKFISSIFIHSLWKFLWSHYIVYMQTQWSLSAKLIH